MIFSPSPLFGTDGEGYFYLPIRSQYVYKILAESL